MPINYSGLREFLERMQLGQPCLDIVLDKPWVPPPEITGTTIEELIERDRWVRLNQEDTGRARG